jgi:hypothetical protein
MDAWEEKVLAELCSENSQKDYRNTVFWSCVKYSQVAIYRDPRWFARNLPDMAEFWNLVLSERELIANGLPNSEHYPKPKVTRSVRSSAKSVCLICDSDDEEKTPQTTSKQTGTIITKLKKIQKPKNAEQSHSRKSCKSVCLISSNSDSD